MKILISPAKKMTINTDEFAVKRLPVLLEDTKKLMTEIRKLSCEEAKALWKCNDKLAKLNYERFKKMELEKRLTPAILSYEGLQYQHIAPRVLTENALSYLDAHLCILSGFYGVLSPFDGVVPYRLEMQAKLSGEGYVDLYEFWGRKLYEEISKTDDMIINLASREYAKSVEKYLSLKDHFITVRFGEVVDGRVKEKGTFLKMARGELVRFMAEKQVEDIHEIKMFGELGLRYDETLSDKQTMVFVKEGKGKAEETRKS